jgi:hypothetical protein
MKESKQLVNGQLLGAYLHEIRAGGLDCIGIGQCNRENSFSETRFIGILYMLMTAVLLVICFTLKNPWMIAFGSVGMSSLWYFIWWKGFQKELAYWKMFRKAKEEIEKREYAVDLVFRGFLKIKAQAKGLKDDMEGFNLMVDWVRHNLLNLVMEINEEEESSNPAKSGEARGKLKIKFDIAKHLFGTRLDFDCGYKTFFSRDIEKTMTNFV